MGRTLLVLKSTSDRVRAKEFINKAPQGARVQFSDAKRSLPQNDRLWLMLGCVSEQLLWHGKYWPDTAWKDYFMHALEGEQWMPYEDGGMIPIGRSTSNLDKDDFGQLMELIAAFAARHGVNFPWTEVAQ